MTDEELLERGRRAVRSKNWRWMLGMRAVPTNGLVSVPLRLTDDHDWPHDIGLRLPDLTDPATLGCLVTLVRELYHAPWKLWDGHIEVRRDHQTLFFAMQFSHNPEGFLEEVHVASGQTEVEAWVAALEAA